MKISTSAKLLGKTLLSLNAASVVRGLRFGPRECLKSLQATYHAVDPLSARDLVSEDLLVQRRPDTSALPPVCFVPKRENAGLLTDGTCVLVGALLYEPPIVLVDHCRLYQGNEIGAFTYFSRFCSMLRASVGRFCSIAEGVFLGPWEHPTDRLSTHPFVFNNYGPWNGTSGFEFEVYESYDRIVDRENVLPTADLPRTIIGHDVWIGRNATVLQGVKVGNGAIVAAHSVVTHDVEPYTIVAGIPARPLRKRFDAATIDRLQSLQWWNYDIGSLRPAIDYRDVPAFLDTMEAAVTAGTLQRLDAKFHKLQQVDGKPQVVECF